MVSIVCDIDIVEVCHKNNAEDTGGMLGPDVIWCLFLMGDVTCILSPLVASG